MQKGFKYFSILSKIIEFLKKAQKLAKRIGINNISQPGIVKEMIMAEILKHKINPVKKQHDAENLNNSSIKYEYLTCLEGKSFQFDRVDKENLQNKVLRNKFIYCAIFDKNNLLNILRIYRLNPKKLYPILFKKFERSTSTSRHVGFTEKQIINQNLGKIVYPQSP